MYCISSCHHYWFVLFRFPVFLRPIFFIIYIVRLTKYLSENIATTTNVELQYLVELQYKIFETNFYYILKKAVTTIKNFILVIGNFILIIVKKLFGKKASENQSTAFTMFIQTINDYFIQYHFILFNIIYLKNISLVKLHLIGYIMISLENFYFFLF